MGEPSQHPSVEAVYVSTGDGDRYVIVDDHVHDLTGWRIEIRQLPPATDGGWGRRENVTDDELDPTTSRIEEFTREQTWFGRRPEGGWNGLGIGTLHHPWSASCDHGWRIVRWIPPTS